MSGPITSRRAVLAGGAGCAAAAVALGRDAPVPAGVAAADPRRPTVVLQDRRLPIPADIAARLAGNGAQLLPLEEDPVRMWRGELKSLLDSRGTRLLGVTQWPQFLLVAGLAAESGRRVRYQRHDAGAGAFVWLIA